MDMHTLRSEGLSVSIKADGAELCSLKNAEGLELLWRAGPEWPRHAPLLFPIVGRLKNDELRYRGKSYPMTQHGFARDCRFIWLEREPTCCRLVLENGPETLAHYPFAFRLMVTYAVRDADLTVTLQVFNMGEEILPASVGAHPAFNWPLSPQLTKEDYRLVFSSEEAAPIRRLSNGLVRPEPEPTPVRGEILDLSERLFADDAIIMDRLASSSVRYEGTRGPSIEMSWDGFRELGIWSKPQGAPFLCIEPWRGTASPSDFDGEFIDKPGLMHIPPAKDQILIYRVRVT
jgi:galactose mutarotase-like enzyme